MAEVVTVTHKKVPQPVESVSIKFTPGELDYLIAGLEQAYRYAFYKDSTPSKLKAILLKARKGETETVTMKKLAGPSLGEYLQRAYGTSF